MGRARQGVLGLNPPSRSALRWTSRLWFPIATAILIQALLFISFPPEFTPDSRLYMAPAESLARSGSALNAAGEPETVVTPGYPLFLAVFLAAPLGGAAGAVAAQRILWIAVVTAVTWISFRLTRSTIAAVVAGLILACDLPALQATNSILTETIATVAVGAAVWQAYRSTTVAGAVAAGLLAGVAALIRPVAIFLGVPLALAIWIAGSRDRRGRLAAAILAASLVVPSAWVVRNYLQTGIATYSSLGSINLLLYRAAGTLAIRDPGGVDANLQRRQAELEEAACQVVTTRFGRDCAAVPITQRATVYSGLALPIILGDPVATAMQASRAFVMIMFGGGANMLSQITGLAESRTRMIAFAYTVPLALLALLGLSYWWRVDRLAASLMALAIAYLVLISLGVEAYSRFRVPFLPFYAMLAGGGAEACRRYWQRPSR